MAASDVLARFKRRVKVRVDGELVSLASLGPIQSIAEFRALLPVIGGRDIATRASTVKGAGTGLFASRAFAKGEIVSFYSGALIRYVNPASLQTALLTHARNLVVMTYTILGNVKEDGSGFIQSVADRRGLGGIAFVNDPLASGQTANIEYDHVDTAANERVDLASGGSIDPRGRLIVGIAKRDVARDEEFFVSYGRDYWKRQSEYESREAGRPLMGLADVRALLVGDTRLAKATAAEKKRMNLLPLTSACRVCDADATGSCSICAIGALLCSEQCLSVHAEQAHGSG